MDKNDLRLVGKIGYNYKITKAQNGKEYASFAIEVEARSNAQETENNYHQTIHVMCFKPNVVKYLKKVKARQGNNVIVFGFISSYPSEIKGKQIVANGVCATEIYVIKTMSDDEIYEKLNK